LLIEFTLLYKCSSCAAGGFKMRVILNPLMPNKDGYLTPVKPSQVYHCDNINQFVTQVVKSGSLNTEYVDLCNIVGYSEEKADVKTLVEILKDLFFEKHLALTADFDE
jgi:hypothetical protein